MLKSKFAIVVVLGMCLTVFSSTAAFADTDSPDAAVSSPAIGSPSVVEGQQAVTLAVDAVKADIAGDNEAELYATTTPPQEDETPAKSSLWRTVLITAVGAVLVAGTTAISRRLKAADN
jgi:hypothetical protein